MVSSVATVAGLGVLERRLAGSPAQVARIRGASLPPGGVAAYHDRPGELRAHPVAVIHAAYRGSFELIGADGAAGGRCRS